MSEYDERMMKTKQRSGNSSHGREVDVKWILLKVSFPDTYFRPSLLHQTSASLLFATYFFFFAKPPYPPFSHVNFKKYFLFLPCGMFGYFTFCKPSLHMHTASTNVQKSDTRHTLEIGCSTCSSGQMGCGCISLETIGLYMKLVGLIGGYSFSCTLICWDAEGF